MKHLTIELTERIPCFLKFAVHEVIELREKYFEVEENEKFVKGDLFKLIGVMN